MEDRSLQSVSTEGLVENDTQQDNHEKIWQRVDDIDDPHHDKIHFSTGVSGDGAVQNADDQNQKTGKQADCQRDSGAVDDTDKVVAAHLVGAKDMWEHFAAFCHVSLLHRGIMKWGEVFGTHVPHSVHRDDLVIGVGHYGWKNKNGEHDDDQDDQADHGQRVLAEPAHSVPEECCGTAHDIGLSALFVRGRGKVGAVELGEVDLRAQEISLRERIGYWFHNSLPLSVQFDPRVDNLVEDIGQQIHCDHDRGEEQSRSHDHGIVPVVDARHKLLSESADGKNVFDDQGTGDNIRKLRPNIGDHRNESISECMFEQNFTPGDALGLSCANIVLTQDIQHARLGKSCNVSRRIERQGDDRQYIVRTVCAPDREPPQLDTEHIEQKRGENKARHSRQQCCEENDDPVWPSVPVEGRQATKYNAENNGHQEGHAAQPSTDGKPASNGGLDFPASLDADAPVPVEQVVQIDKILGHERFIQIVPFLQCRLDLRRRGLFRVEGAAGDGIHREERDDADDKQRKDGEQNPLPNVAFHGLPLFSYMRKL